jgi:hypothetical protein
LLVVERQYAVEELVPGRHRLHWYCDTRDV